MNDEQTVEVPWDGDKTVSMRPGGVSFSCGVCDGPMSSLPFGDIIHGAPDRVFYCRSCEAIVPPELSLEILNQMSEWLNLVFACCSPKDVDREELPEHRDPTVPSGLLTPDGSSVDELRQHGHLLNEPRGGSPRH